MIWAVLASLGVAGLVAMAAGPGPLRWLGALAIVLVGELAWQRLRYPNALFSVAVLSGFAWMALACRRVPSMLLVRCLGVLCALHFGSVLIQAAGWHAQGAIWGGPGWKPAWPVAGVADNANVAVLLGGITAPMVWAAVQRGTRRTRTLTACFLAAGILTLLWTSRSIGGVGIFAGAFLAWSVDPRRFDLRKFLLVATIGVAAIGLYWWQVDRPGWERLEAWRLALRGPFSSVETVLVGYGLGSWEHLSFGRTDALGRLVVQHTTWDTAHNDHVQLWFEGGFLALACWTGAIGSCLRRAWRHAILPEGRAVMASSVAWVLGACWYFPAHLQAAGSVGLALAVLSQRLGAEREERLR